MNKLQTMPKVQTSANPNGGTFKLENGKLTDYQPKTGYTIGTKTKIVNPSEFSDLLEFFQIVRRFANLNNAKFVGYWLDTKTGLYHVDIVEFRQTGIEAFSLAIASGGQLAIRNNAKNEEIRLEDYLQSEVSDSQLVIYRRFRFDQTEFVIISELVNQYGDEELIGSDYLRRFGR